MIWSKTHEQHKVAVKRREDWHLWFAWHPIQLNTGRTCWLQKRYRKGEYCCSYDGGSWEYEYREYL